MKKPYPPPPAELDDDAAPVLGEDFFACARRESEVLSAEFLASSQARQTKRRRRRSKADRANVSDPAVGAQIARLREIPIDQHLARLREETLKPDGYVTNRRWLGMLACSVCIVDATGHWPPAPGQEHPFFEAVPDAEGAIGFAYESKMHMVADVIFRIKDEPWYPAVRQHWRQHDLGDAFWEVGVSQFFAEAGLKPRFRERKHKPREDFDFVVEGQGVTLNVEVHKYKREPLDPKALLNRLKSKKHQLPKGEPAVMALSHPQSWFIGVRQEDLEARLDDVARNFFRQTERVVAILWLHEQHQALGDKGGGVAPMYRLVVNDKAAPAIREALRGFQHPGYDTLQQWIEDGQRHMSESPLLQWIDGVWAERMKLDPLAPAAGPRYVGAGKSNEGTSKVVDITEPALRTELFDVPRAAISNFNISVAPTEFIVVCSSHHPSILDGQIVLRPKPEIMLAMSPQASKDLAALLSDAVANYERELGVIDTPFLRERAAKAAAADAAAQ